MIDSVLASQPPNFDVDASGEGLILKEPTEHHVVYQCEECNATGVQHKAVHAAETLNQHQQSFGHSRPSLYPPLRRMLLQITL